MWAAEESDTASFETRARLRTLRLGRSRLPPPHLALSRGHAPFRTLDYRGIFALRNSRFSRSLQWPETDVRVALAVMAVHTSAGSASNRNTA